MSILRYAALNTRKETPMETPQEQEIYGGPFYIPDAPADEKGLRVSDIARALAEPGFDIRQASTFIHTLLAAGRIRPYGRTRADKRQAHLFRADQVLIAAIQHRMIEAGIVAGPALQAATLSLDSWNDADLPPDGERPAPNPAAWVMRGYLSGFRDFGFEMIAVRNVGTEDKPGRGQLVHRARVRHLPSNSGTSFHMPGHGWVRRSVFALDLDVILGHITREKATH